MGGNIDNLFKESYQKINLFCIASVFYYIIRSYNSKILRTKELIKKDFEIENIDLPFKLLDDDHPIYNQLIGLIQDGIDNISKFMDEFAEKIDKNGPNDTEAVDIVSTDSA